MDFKRNFIISIMCAHVLSLCELTAAEACNRTDTTCVFLNIIFEKYGYNDILPFEGYEHLIENLNLAGIAIDHSVQNHRQKPSAEFINIHSNHDHVLESGHRHGHSHNNQGTENALGNGHDHMQNNGHVHGHLHDKRYDHTLEEGQDHTHEGRHDHKRKHGHDHTHEDGHDHISDGKLDHKLENHGKSNNRSNHAHDHGSDLELKMTSKTPGHDHSVVRRSTLPDVDIDSSTVIKKCLSPLELLGIYGFKNDKLTPSQFLDLCPAIIIQLDLHLCQDQQSKESIISDQSNKKSSKAVWGYGCAAIIVISIMGMLAVGIISVIQRVSVSLILQFFVSLAVGALLGDAFLHLIPHSLQIESGHSHDEGGGHGTDGIMKGLCGLAIIMFFFLIGRIQGIIMSNKLRKKLIVKEDHSYYSEEVTVLNGNSGVLEKLQKELEDIENIQLDSFDNTHHHNNNGHGHSHGDDLPTTAGAMVWRVIVGDGIHNFSDGLAIGVAFSHSVTGGISTAIAVLCHELPHEMGDFAVLLKKGMTIKRAFLYNCLSSLLSLIGMFIGIAVGNIQAVKLYIFLCVAAMFIYISLVDMLPEISTCDSSRPLMQLFCHVCGMLLGYSVMLTIALKEEDLKKILDT